MLNINFWNIAFTVINLLVLYLFLKHFLMKPLMEIMEKRQAQVETDLNDAASEKQEAIRLKEPLLSPSGEGPVEVQDRQTEGGGKAAQPALVLGQQLCRPLRHQLRPLPPNGPPEPRRDPDQREASSGDDQVGHGPMLALAPARSPP